MSSDTVVATKPATKDLSQDRKADTPKSGRSLFNADDFLSRVHMNDKINNILRSPTKTPNGVRQRSVYTAINPTPSRFNHGALSFAASHHQGQTSVSQTVQSALPRSNSNTNAAAVLAAAVAERSNNSSTTSVKDLSGNAAAQAQAQARAILQMQMTGISPHHYPGYEPMTARNSIARGMFNNRFPMAPPPPQLYGYDGEATYRVQFPTPMPPPPYAVGRISARGLDYDNQTPPGCPGAGPIAMSNGTIQLRLRDGIRIDITLDKAVRVLNQRSMVAIALSRNCSNSALIHPNGRVLQSGSKVEIVTYDGMKTNSFVRYAKMWYKGVSFTSESCALIYLVDTAGTRTTTDTFTDLTKDYTLSVFYDDSRHGPSFMQDANEVIQNSTYTCTDEGTEIYEINGFRITQAADGLVKLTRTHNKCLIRTSPGNGSATLTTPGIHCTASLGKTSHLFVRRNEKRMHFDGSCFIVRNAGHSAGFNENNLLIVY